MSSQSVSKNKSNSSNNSSATCLTFRKLDRTTSDNFCLHGIAAIDLHSKLKESGKKITLRDVCSKDLVLNSYAGTITLELFLSNNTISKHACLNYLKQSKVQDVAEQVNKITNDLLKYIK